MPSRILAPRAATFLPLGSSNVKNEKDFKPFKSELPPVLKAVEWMSFDECVKEVQLLHKQFIVLHSLPKVDGRNVNEYMHETLELMRRRCVKLHWRKIELQVEALKKRKTVYSKVSSN